MSTCNLCFRAKRKENMYIPVKLLTIVLLYKMGCKEVSI